jgi:hypothetical protein
VTAWGVTARLAVAALVFAACSSDEPDASPTTREPTPSSTTTSAPERPASTTTTAFDPASVEGQVEAAYLRSWDVYADAVYDLVLDEEALAEVYAAEGLTTLLDEISGRIDEDRASLVHVEHNYEVSVSSEIEANVIDQIVNHQVVIDAQTKEPLEEDPNERQLLNFKLKRIDGTWKVTFIQRVRG